MQNTVKRILVEKKPGFDVEARHLYLDLKENLGISKLERVRIINRYDISGLSDQDYERAKNTIFSEPNVDFVHDEKIDLDPNLKHFAVEYLPGQYDQRADSAAQCIQILTQGEPPSVLSSKLILLYGDISANDYAKIKNYCINPVDSREAPLEKPLTLEMETIIPQDIAILDGFIQMEESELASWLTTLGLVMSLADLKFCQGYFRDNEKRNPTLTELKVIDTYWSDHCRHTTFLTSLDKISIADGGLAWPIKKAYETSLKDRNQVYGSKIQDLCLMDLALLGMKKLRQEGRLPDLDISDEVNACSIVVEADVNGKKEEWLIMFKNETHNHPTEIEPFGGAATCLGGAIRDPLSGRVYVYQAMRVTGCGDPRTSIDKTLPGKLSQRKITTGAAAGYSSYGNQIGLATGHVAEVYDDGFIAKRMEVGAVIGAAPKANVTRATPTAGDIVILLGGLTGRDGCGGATGSSVEHTRESIFNCGAEVQKGNPPTERKIQRLFRNPQASKLIKKCNDFGAGGVSVAIGELTDGLLINLDKVPKKYEGLDGTELAISESQERMAVVVEREKAALFIDLAASENLDAVAVAEVTAERRLKMLWRGSTIVDIARDFLDTNGVKQHTNVTVQEPATEDNYFTTRAAKLPLDLKEAWLNNLQDLNVCSQRGLIELFDSSIGAATVLMPLGGKYQATPAVGMAAKLPVESGDTTTGTLMTFGYNPQIAKWSPFHGAIYAIIEAVSKIVAMGGNYQTIRLSLQEYFEKLGTDSRKWGKPLAALLGAYQAQIELGIPAIGGKDSMSGTFLDLNVPPTLVAFAVNPVDVRQIISPEYKETNSQVVFIPVVRDTYEIPDFALLKETYQRIYQLIQDGQILAAYPVREGGIAEAISKMSFGNQIGFTLADPGLTPHALKNLLFSPEYGSLVVEMPENADVQQALGSLPYRILGQTQAKAAIEIGSMNLSLQEAQTAWETPLEKVFPTRTAKIENAPPPALSLHRRSSAHSRVTLAKPRVFIPVFPGTNCEYDTQKRFAMAGAQTDLFIFNNLSPTAIEESIQVMAARISKAQIIMLPGGFSAGDEPDGSGKFIAAVFRNPRVCDTVMELLKNRDGLILGICNGFQALIKLGLLPYGEIRDIEANQPTLTYNWIGRHMSRMVKTRIASVLSPWFANVEVGDIHQIAVSHGEGRFVASEEDIQRMAENGQIAAQYVDEQGQPTYDIRFNPNGSFYAIEAITSPDGRVLGKMAHSERIGSHLYINIPHEKDQRLFTAGVNYFK
ncbi:Phosphoribosylformylglycinamidine synthase, FGAM [Syntrophomonas zehnderi OL-4]|uniref:Phosphoribosylformylglycinamidine synthase, FGAM n=1 Tax=Syntrophomonas zehnderi OL-4 TaxID=690567 RepID=A0A0E3W317_9FIRM|nr:phosphoribosylformylglycinamidine synthase [Syntrophomonas zehnderi]CFX40616.1 Phosphoribosylformylglycinamidine synthase, FGAM [Syntrophomonas zehnderi OL-4]